MCIRDRLETLLGQLHLEVVQELAGLGLHHGVGHIGGDVLSHLLHQGVLKGALHGLLPLGGDLLLQSSLQVLQGVELADVLGELIVQGGDCLLYTSRCV